MTSTRGNDMQELCLNKGEKTWFYPGVINDHVEGGIPGVQ
jgi:hypothetical protein